MNKGGMIWKSDLLQGTIHHGVGVVYTTAFREECICIACMSCFVGTVENKSINRFIQDPVSASLCLTLSYEIHLLDIALDVPKKIPTIDCMSDIALGSSEISCKVEQHFSMSLYRMQLCTSRGYRWIVQLRRQSIYRIRQLGDQCIQLVLQFNMFIHLLFCSIRGGSSISVHVERRMVRVDSTRVGRGGRCIGRSGDFGSQRRIGGEACIDGGFEITGLPTQDVPRLSVSHDGSRVSVRGVESSADSNDLEVSNDQVPGHS